MIKIFIMITLMVSFINAKEDNFNIVIPKYLTNDESIADYNKKEWGLSTRYNGIRNQIIIHMDDTIDDFKNNRDINIDETWLDEMYKKIIK